MPRAARVLELAVIGADVLEPHLRVARRAGWGITRPAAAARSALAAGARSVQLTHPDSPAALILVDTAPGMRATIETPQPGGPARLCMEAACFRRIVEDAPVVAHLLAALGRSS